MYMVVKCPKHLKDLVFFKDTATHSLFKCPVCDYVDYPGVVHKDLPEKYQQLQAENEKLKELQKWYESEIFHLEKAKQKYKQAIKEKNGKEKT